jgi:hypothetical protein
MGQEIGIGGLMPAAVQNLAGAGPQVSAGGGAGRRLPVRTAHWLCLPRWPGNPAHTEAAVCLRAVASAQAAWHNEHRAAISELDQSGSQHEDERDGKRALHSRLGRCVAARCSTAAACINCMRHPSCRLLAHDQF